MADYKDIAGRIRTTAGDGVVVEAQEMKDLLLDKSQQEVNADVQQGLSDRYTKEETYNREEIEELVDPTNYVSVVATNQTTAVTDLLPATGEADTIYRIGNWDGTQYDPTVYALYSWKGTAYVCLAVRSFVGEIYDISANHPDGQGNSTVYADLAAALGTDGANIPADIRRGGMTVKFIQGDNVQSSDNKYVQFRLMKNTWSTTVTDWQGVDTEVTSGSKNLIESNGVFDKTYYTNEENLSFTTKLTGYIRPEQTIGQTVSINTGASQHMIFNIPANAAAKIEIKSGGSYGFALCDSNDVVLEYCDNSESEHLFSIYNEATKLYVSESKVNKVYSVTYKSVKERVTDLGDALTILSSTGYKYIGIASTTTTPIQTTEKVFYLSPREGTFTNFLDSDNNPIELPLGINILKTNGDGHWIGSTLIRIDKIPSNTDDRLVTSKAAYDIVNNEIFNANVYLYGKSDNSHIVTLQEAINAANNAGLNNVARVISYYSGYKEANIAIFAHNAFNTEFTNPDNWQVLSMSQINAALLDINDFIEERTLITEEDSEVISTITKSIGYVNPNQNIGDTIVFDTSSSGLGNIYQNLDIPANSIVTVDFSATTGDYGYAICDEEDKIIEICSNKNKTSYTFAKTNVKTRFYASSKKFSGASRVTIQTETVKNAIKGIQNRLYTDEGFWKGKTIWWCGTSIPAGSDDTIPGAGETIAGNYPMEVGNDLGATVINKSVGGSMCRANVRTGDYVGANFSNITSALSMTKVEIENFITNYATIKDLLTGNPHSTLSDSDKARLRAASFEDRLLPYLDGTYEMPDLFVFDHGHNDFKYKLADGTTSDITLEPTVANIGGELTEDTYMTANNNENLESFFGSLNNIPSAKKNSFISSVNRNCFIGAENFLITLILHYNPHARIIFISNYEYENGDNKNYAPLITSQDSISKSWALPICRVYEYLGYSDHIIPGSMNWFNTTYPAQTPVDTDINVFKAYLPDNVHPHSDVTGYSNNIYAGIISEFIRRIR